MASPTPLHDFIKRQTSSRSVSNRPRSVASFQDHRERPHSPAVSEIDTASIFTPPRPFSPATDDGRARMFDVPSGSLSLSGGSDTVNIDPRRREQMERMKLPVPSFAQKPSQMEDEKKKAPDSRGLSEDSLVELDGQPEGFDNGPAGQQPQATEYYYDDDHDDSYDYDQGTEGRYEQQQHGDDQYDDGNDDYDGQYGQANGHYEPDNDGGYEYQIKQEQDEEMMWRDETPSITDQGFGDAYTGGYDDAQRPPTPPRTAAPERRRSGSFHYRPALPAKDSKAQQKAPAQQTFFSRRQSVPGPGPSEPFIQRPATVIPAPGGMPQPAPSRRQVTIRQSSPPRSRHPQIDDPDRTIRPQHNERESTVPLANPPRELLTRSLLSDAELRAIPTYDKLLEAIQSRYLSSRSTPPANMTHELETIIKFAYPEKDTTRPNRFFEDLPDDAYDIAGDAIVQKKREIEDKLKVVARKRRKVVSTKAAELAPVAEDRVERLKRLNGLRQEFRQGVAGLLSMSGMNL